MTDFRKLLLAITVLGSSAAAQAESSNFAGLTYGQTNSSAQTYLAANYAF